MKKDNSATVLIQLIRELHIPVTAQTVEDELEKHPDYPSLLAISDVLNNWKVPNGAFALTFEELAELPVPFVVHFSSNDGEFVLVSKLDEKKVLLSNEHWDNHLMDLEEFKRLYIGSVLAAETDTESGEAGYAIKRRKELIEELRLPFVLSGLAMILLSGLILNTTSLLAFNWPLALLMLIKTTGITVSVLLLMQSVDANNPLIQRLCSGDKGNNCNAILSSKAAKITEELSWSEVGFFYFAGTFLVLLLNSGSPSVIQTLAMLNLLSLPYTIWSIYHQWKVAKQWCVLCCTVQGLLWLEFFAFLPYLLQDFSLANAGEWSIMVMCMLAPVIAWVFIKPYLMQSKQIQPLKQQLRRFKYNSELFQKMLKEEVKYALPEDKHSLILGNPEAENIITMVSNPYCQPCAKAHKALDELLEGKEDVKLQVVFATKNDEKDPKTKVAAHLMSLKSNRDDLSLKKAMNDWYEQKLKNYDSWAKLYPVGEDAGVNEAMEKQKEWCKLAEIHSTPTILLNGHVLPKPYQLQDIKYFI